MKTIKDYLSEILSHVQKKNNESLKMSMRDVHAKGMFSLVIAGDQPGRLTRIFIAEEKLRPFDVQYHTHRYPITITILKGDITHYRAFESKLKNDTSRISLYEYRSILNGGDGLTYKKEIDILQHMTKMPVGSQIDLGIDDFHTMSCSKGSMWIVEEKGFDQEYSEVLGVPFVTDDLYKAPAMFQIVDKTQAVSRQIRNILLQYELTKN